MTRLRNSAPLLKAHGDPKNKKDRSRCMSTSRTQSILIISAFDASKILVSFETQMLSLLHFANKTKNKKLLLWRRSLGKLCGFLNVAKNEH